MKPIACTLLLLLGLVSPLAGQANPYVLSINDSQAPSGSQVEHEVIFDHMGNDVAGWAMGVCHDDDLLELVVAEDGALIPTLNGGSGPDFNDLALIPGQGFTVGLLINFLGMDVLLPGSYQLNIATYNVIGPDGVTTQIEFCSTIGAPPVSTVIVDSGNMSWDPEQVAGTVTIGAPPPPPVPFFKRGDANGDGTFSGLADGVFVLNYQFIPGSAVPPCLDAADADDSGSVSGLVDGLLILNHQFQPGSPPPAPPGPTQCGEDPTDDLLDCLEEPTVCQ